MENPTNTNLQEHGPEVLASTIEEFVAHQDDPVWRMKIAEDWYENLIKIPVVIKEKIEEVKQEWEGNGEEGLLAEIKRLEEGGNYPGLVADYKVKLENFKKYRSEDGTIDFDTIAREDILRECRETANSSNPNIFIPFADYYKWMEQFARYTSRGNQKEYEDTMNSTGMLAPRSMTVDNPTFMIAPGKTEEFLIKFKKDMVDGLVSGLKQPKSREVDDEDELRIIFKEKDGSQKIASLTLYKQSSQSNYGEIKFVCIPFSQEVFEKTGNFNAWINSVPTTSYSWTGTKSFMMYLKQNNISFELVDKGNNVYAYHLLKLKE